MNRYNLSNVINRTHKSNWMNCAKRTIESTKPKCRCTIHHFKLTARELWVETKCICIYLRVIRSGARWTFVFLLLCSMGFWMMSIHMDWYPCDDGDGFWSAESANDKWERRKTIAWKKKHCCEPSIRYERNQQHKNETTTILLCEANLFWCDNCKCAKVYIIHFM